MASDERLGEKDSTFLFVIFLLLFTFWVTIGGVLYVTMKGIGHDTQECARDEHTPPAENGSN